MAQTKGAALPSKRGCQVIVWCRLGDCALPVHIGVLVTSALHVLACCCQGMVSCLQMYISESLHAQRCTLSSSRFAYVPGWVVGGLLHTLVTLPLM